MQFVELTLERIGAGTEAGSVLEEFSEELSALAAKVADEERFGKKGKITLSLDLMRSGDAIVVSGAVQVKAPAKMRKSAVGYFSHGKLLTQDAEQIALPFDSGVTKAALATGDREIALIERAIELARPLDDRRRAERANRRVERDEEDHDPDTGEVKPRRSPKTIRSDERQKMVRDEEPSPVMSAGGGRLAAMLEVEGEDEEI